MVANGKLHSLQKIIFFFGRCLRIPCSLLGYRALLKGKVLPIPVILFTALLFCQISDQPTMTLTNNWAKQPTDRYLLEATDNMTNLNKHFIKENSSIFNLDFHT